MWYYIPPVTHGETHTVGCGCQSRLGLSAWFTTSLKGVRVREKRGNPRGIDEGTHRWHQKARGLPKICKPPKAFRRFPIPPKAYRRSPEVFENFRRLPKNTRRMRKVIRIRTIAKHWSKAFEVNRVSLKGFELFFFNQVKSYFLVFTCFVIFKYLINKILRFISQRF